MATIEASQEGTYLLGVALAALLLGVFEAPRALMSVAAITCVAALVGYQLLERDDTATASGETDRFDTAAETIAVVRPSPHGLGAGPWPHWMPPTAQPWTVSRRGPVARLEAYWPLVNSDWDAIIRELSVAVDEGARAVVLPTKLPPGSRVASRALDELWATLLEMSVTVTRSGESAGSLTP
jgi:hypothetical protein